MPARVRESLIWSDSLSGLSFIFTTCCENGTPHRSAFSRESRYEETSPGGMKKGRGMARFARRGQTGYSQPIPKTGIGGSPRFAAHFLPAPPKRLCTRYRSVENRCYSRG